MWIHVYPNWKTYLNSKNGRKISFSQETKASKSFIPMRRMWLWCPILKTKEITMWMHVYPNWKTNLNSKNGRKTSFPYEIKASKSFISTKRMWIWCPNMKREKIIMWIHVYPNWKMNLNSKSGRKTSFFYEPKAAKSFIPTRRIWIWCPNTKREEIIMWIQVYPNWMTNLSSKNGKKRSFSYEIKASKSFITIKRMRLWCPIMKRKEIIMWIHVYPNWRMNLNSKNGRKTSFPYEIKASKSFISTKRMWIWCPNMKREKIIMWIHVYPNWKMNLNSKSGRKTSFSYETKASKYLSQRGECDYGAQSWKE